LKQLAVMGLDAYSIPKALESAPLPSQRVARSSMRRRSRREELCAAHKPGCLTTKFEFTGSVTLEVLTAFVRAPNALAVGDPVGGEGAGSGESIVAQLSGMPGGTARISSVPAPAITAMAR
jgi:hypothetical protein